MKVAVAGAGISGLALAHALRARGVETVVFEAEAAPGGKVRTGREGGYTFEWGPNGFLDREPATMHLVGELGLKERLVAASGAAKHRYLWARGRLRSVPLSPPALLRSDLLSARGKLRAAAEVLGRRRGGGGDGDESVFDFAVRRVGREAADSLVDPMVAGIFAGDPHELSLRAAFPRVAELEREHRSLLLGMVRTRARPGQLRSFRGGMQEIVDALASRLGSALRPRAPLRALAREANGWRLAGEGWEERAGAVVLALPACDAAPLVAPLDGAAAEAMRAIPYAKVAVVHLAFERASLAHPLDGFGFLVPSHEELRLLGTVFASSIFPDRAATGAVLLTAMAGGTRRPEMCALDDAELTQAVREDLARALGVRAPPVFQRVIRWERGIPQYTLGHLKRVAAVEAAERRLPGLYFAGNAYRGVAFNDCVRDAVFVAERIARAQGAS